jgi:hypothetical protein
MEETDRVMSDGTSAAADSTFAHLPATIPVTLRREGQSHGEVSTHMTLWCPPLDMLLGDRTGSECFEYSL